MRIAVDAVGGDYGAAVVLPGAIAGARRFGVGLELVGPEAEVRRGLVAVDARGVDLEVVDAPETIAMDESPTLAVRRKSRSSIGVALEAVRDGRAAAMVSAGNSGAVMAAALLVLGRVPGVERPAIAGLLPSIGQPTLVLDLGAVTDPKPQHLVQFAQMGSIYARPCSGAPGRRSACLATAKRRRRATSSCAKPFRSWRGYRGSTSAATSKDETSPGASSTSSSPTVSPATLPSRSPRASPAWSAR